MTTVRLACGLWVVLLTVAAAGACGDDEGAESTRRSSGIEDGDIAGGAECTDGMVQSPAPECDCPGGVGRRFCTEDGIWDECECVERDDCLDIIDFICPNDCPGDPAPRSVGPCVDGEPPNCRCPDGSPRDESDAGSDDEDAG